MGERRRGERDCRIPSCLPQHPVWRGGAREQMCFSEGLTMHNTDCLLQGLCGNPCPGACLGHRKSPKTPEIKVPPAWARCWAPVGPLQKLLPGVGGAGGTPAGPARALQWGRDVMRGSALSSRKELTAEARELKGELYCLPCHDKMGVPICGACRRPIEGRVVNALGKQWHVEVSEARRLGEPQAHCYIWSLALQAPPPRSHPRPHGLLLAGIFVLGAVPLWLWPPWEPGDLSAQTMVRQWCLPSFLPLLAF